MTIDSAILSDRRVTSDTQNGEVFHAPRLAAGSLRLAPTLSPLTSSIWTSPTFSKKYSIDQLNLGTAEVSAVADHGPENLCVN